MLTATVRGPTEEFQKILTSSPSSASDLVFPAEKHPYPPKTAVPPTYNGQNGTFWPTRAVFQQYVGGTAVFGGNGRFSAGSSNSDADWGLYLRDFWNSSVGPRNVAVNMGVVRRIFKISGSVGQKSEQVFERPPKNCSKIKKIRKMFYFFLFFLKSLLWLLLWIKLVSPKLYWAPQKSVIP